MKRGMVEGLCDVKLRYINILSERRYHGLRMCRVAMTVVNRLTTMFDQKPMVP